MTIEESLGIAMGRLNMSLGDFEKLTPDEFEAVLTASMKYEEQRLHEEWYMVREHAALTMQPHLRKPIRAKDILPFPWEKEETGHRKSDKSRFIELVNKLDNGK